jgi:hypothetical protein
MLSLALKKVANGESSLHCGIIMSLRCAITATILDGFAWGTVLARAIEMASKIKSQCIEKQRNASTQKTTTTTEAIVVEYQRLLEH